MRISKIAGLYGLCRSRILPPHPTAVKMGLYLEASALNITHTAYHSTGRSVSRSQDFASSSKLFYSKSTSSTKPDHNMNDIPEGVLLGLGNPLLDITIKGDKKLLKKYGLLENNAIEADEKHQAMFDEIVADYNPTYIAGGANQNTIRVAQWMLQRPNATTFLGCVGNDKMGAAMREKAEDIGVRVVYQTDMHKGTGVCAAIITGENRSLVSRLGAALHFKVDFLVQQENWKFIEKAQCFYLCGFLFAVSPESIAQIAEHACAHNKYLVMNLSAPYLCKYYANPDGDIIQYVDILFGNETEAATFCELKGIATKDIKQMAIDVSKLPKKNNKRSRLVIFTQGRDPTIVAFDGAVAEQPVIPVEKSLIKDTNGCGDAFVGGFLSQLVQGKSLFDCLQCASYAARTIIQQWGCTYPPKPDL